MMHACVYIYKEKGKGRWGRGEAVIACAKVRWEGSPLKCTAFLLALQTKKYLITHKGDIPVNDHFCHPPLTIPQNSIEENYWTIIRIHKRS